MGWHAYCIENTVKITPEMRDSLFLTYANDSENITGDWREPVYHWYNLRDVLDKDNHLTFTDEEGVDYLGNIEGMLDKLVELGARGRICFGDLEGGGIGARFWGYEFTDSGCTELTGTVTWSPTLPEA